MEGFKREIFEKLGNLFYALAADEQVTLMESGELKMLLKKDWLAEPGEPSADKVSEAAHLIGLTIDELQSRRVPAMEAYKNFVGFYRKHSEQFSYALKEKILETSEAIVNIFDSGHQNPHLDDLRDLLEQTGQDTPFHPRTH